MKPLDPCEERTDKESDYYQTVPFAKNLRKDKITEYMRMLPEEMVLEVAQHLDGLSLLALATTEVRLYDLLAPLVLKRTIVVVISDHWYYDRFWALILAAQNIQTVIIQQFHRGAAQLRLIVHRLRVLLHVKQTVRYLTFISSNLSITIVRIISTKKVRHSTRGNFIIIYGIYDQHFRK